MRQPIWGWLGRRDPFEMAQGYEVADGMRGLLSGTPPVLALTAVDEGVRVVAGGRDRGDPREGDRPDRRSRSRSSTSVWRRLGVSIASPRDPAVRGAHVALAVEGASELCAALIARDVVVDFRRPDVIRFGLSPLTTRFVDVWDGVEALRDLLEGR